MIHKKIIVVSQYMKLKRDNKSITAMKIRAFLKNKNSLDLYPKRTMIINEIINHCSFLFVLNLQLCS